MNKQIENELTLNEKKKILNIKNKIKKLIKEGKYDNAIISCEQCYYLDSKNGSEKFNYHLKHEIVKLYNNYIVYLLNSDLKIDIKKYFKDCNEYIGNNIFSYLITQNNYSCFLSQNNYDKQAKITMKTILKVDIINHLSGIVDEDEDKDNSLSNIDKDYSSLSSIENNLKNYQNSLILGMESLVLKQFQTLFCDNKKDNQIYLGYYLIGTQQEVLKRENDSKISFLFAKNYLKESKLNNSEKKNYEFINKLQSYNSKSNQINFIDGFNSLYSYLKTK